MTITTRSVPRWLGWLASLLVALAVALTTGALTLTFLNRSNYASPELFTRELFNWPEALLWAVVGALILSRHPDNTIGWLSLIIALSGSFQEFATGVARYAIAGSITPPPIAIFLAWVANWIFVPYLVSRGLLPLVFPTGRSPSGRWRRIGLGLVAAGALFGFLAMFQEHLNSSALTLGLTNPVGFIPPSVFDVLASLAVILFLGLFAVAVLSLLVRYRGAGHIERSQIKWLLASSALTVAAAGAGWVLGNPDWALIPVKILTWCVPLSIGIAILRYHLWDIDVVIRKTLVYTALTAVLGLVYFGGVVLLQRLVGALTGVEQSQVAVAVSTLVIVVLFAPLRRGIQAVIDRRFYRKKYDAQQVLARFATTARDETNLESLTGELVRVVQETVQPADVSVWLNPNRSTFVASEAHGK